MSLFGLFNLNYWDGFNRVRCDNDAVRQVLEANPDAVKRAYKFRYMVDKVHPLYVAVGAGVSLDIIKLMYDAYPDAIKEREETGGWNVLHFACRHGAALDVISFLIEKCPTALAEVNAAGRTPLFLECMHGQRLDVIQLLVEKYPAAVHLRDNYKNTPTEILEMYRAPPKVTEWLWKVSAPLHTLVSLKDASEQEAISVLKDLVHVFSEMSWKGGIALVLKARPSIVHALGFECALTPNLLFAVSQNNLCTMWSVIKEKPETFDTTRARSL